MAEANNFWLVVWRQHGRGFVQHYDYKQNAHREYIVLLGNPNVKQLMLLHYDGTSIEIFEGKK